MKKNTVNLNLRIPPELHQKLVELAAKNERSLQRQIIYMLQQQLDEQKGKEK